MHAWTVLLLLSDLMIKASNIRNIIMETFAVGPSFKLQNVFFARFWTLAGTYICAKSGALLAANMNNEYEAEKRQPLIEESCVRTVHGMGPKPETPLMNT